MTEWMFTKDSIHPYRIVKFTFCSQKNRRRLQIQPEAELHRRGSQTDVLTVYDIFLSRKPDFF